MKLTRIIMTNGNFYLVEGSMADIRQARKVRTLVLNQSYYNPYSGKDETRKIELTEGAISEVIE